MCNFRPALTAGISASPPWSAGAARGSGPKFLTLCGRVIYRQVDIEAYEESCLATSTKTVAGQTSAG